MSPSNKQRWRRQRDVEYVLVEARPARCDTGPVCSVTLDWLPAHGSGACAAFQALQQASMRQRTPEVAAAFYARLREWAEAQS